MIISKETYPKVYERLYENERNYRELMAAVPKWNREMQSKHGIKFPCLAMIDRIILDDRCADDFSDLCEALGIEPKIEEGGD